MGQFFPYRFYFAFACRRFRPHRLAFVHSRHPFSHILRYRNWSIQVPIVGGVVVANGRSRPKNSTEAGYKIKETSKKGAKILLIKN